MASHSSGNAEPRTRRKPTKSVKADNLSAEDTRRLQIDDRIADLEREILSLKSERNSISLIARLPPELLSRVFTAFAALCPEPSSVSPALYYPANSGERQNERSVKWSVLTEVSQHWRHAALSCPQLWSHITFHKSGWTKLMLQRSKQAPLYLTLHEIMSSETQKHAEEALKQLSRLKHLKFPASTPWAQNRVKELTCPAPLLESLELSLSLYPSRPHESTDLPDDFLGSETPNLRRLSLSGWRLKSWETPVLAGLTSLKLTATVPPPPGVFLDTLEKMSRLDTLELRKVLPDLAAESRVIHLPQLDSLVLDASIHNVANFLSHTNLPPFAHLQLQCSACASDEVSVYGGLAAAISHWISNPLPTAPSIKNPSRVLKTLKVNDFSTYRKLDMTLDFEKIDCWSKLRKSRSPIQLEVSGDAARCSKELFKALPLSDIRALKLAFNLHDTELHYLGRLPRIESLELHRETAGKVIRYLCKDPVMRPAKAPGTSNRRKKLCYFRSLREISLEGPFFDGPGADYVSSFVKLSDFVDLLIMRYEMGGTIERVRIREATNLDEGDVRTMGHICTNVDWDHLIEYASEEDSMDEDMQDYLDDMGYDPYYYHDVSAIANLFF